MSNIRTINRAIEESIRAKLARNPGARTFGMGHFWEFINGKLVNVGEMPDIPDVHGNLWPTEGRHDCLDTWVGATAKAAGSYLALYANAVDPAASWTAANVAATSGEITSTTEGYTQVTRPQYTPRAAGASPSPAGSIDNVGQEAVFTIIGTGPINIEGVFLITNNTRGGTTGKLRSAARYNTTRILQDGDDYRLGYRMTLVST